jgi:hypothetical protein
MRGDLELGEASAGHLGGSLRPRRLLERAVAFSSCALAVIAVGPMVADAVAKPHVSTLYGVTGQRHLQASVRVTNAPLRARAVLESRISLKRRARASATVLSGRVRLAWHVPAALKTVSVRVKLVSGRKRRRTLVVGGWHAIRLAGLKRGATVAKVTASQVKSAPPAGQAGPVELASGRQVRVGEVLALGVGAATPDGLLARVVSVSQSGGAQIAQTLPATLPEVLPVGALDADLVGLQASAFRTHFRSDTPRFGRGVSCSEGVRLEAGGSASISAGVSMNVAWRFPATVTARFEAHAELRSELSASISGKTSCALGSTALLAKPLRLGVFTFTIGPVPVVLIPVVQLYLSANGHVEAAINTSAVASLTANAGVNYDGRAFSQFGGLTPRFTYTPPTLTASGGVQAGVAPTLDVLVNGVGGPRIDLNAGLKLSADIAAAPWWTLTAPISLGAQLRLDVWRAHLASPRLTVYSAEPQLAAAQTQAPPPPLPPPLPPPPPGPLSRAHLTWDNESDVDMHIWDENGNHTYFSAKDAIPGARLLEDIIPGFGPEDFVEDTDQGRRYTFGLCLYKGSAATTKMVIADPGGATRSFERYLPDEKSAALVTTSPDGGGYIPDPGWCGAADPTGIG